MHIHLQRFIDRRKSTSPPFYWDLAFTFSIHNPPTAYVYDAWQEAANERRHFADIHVQSSGPIKRMRLVLHNAEPGAPQSIPMAIKNPKEKVMLPTFVFTELVRPYPL